MVILEANLKKHLPTLEKSRFYLAELDVRIVADVDDAAGAHFGIEEVRRVLEEVAGRTHEFEAATEVSLGEARQRHSQKLEDAFERVDELKANCASIEARLIDDLRAARDKVVVRPLARVQIAVDRVFVHFHEIAADVMEALDELRAHFDFPANFFEKIQIFDSIFSQTN